MGVVKLADYRPPLEVVEHRVAQLEDGFTRVANELLDAVMASGLSETELCVVLAVWRKTYGYNKKMDWVSNDQLEQMIAKHHTHCSTAKNQLVAKKVLVQEGRSVGMNTSIIEWKTKINGFCKTLAKPAKDSLAEVANKTLAESAKETLAEGAKDDGETLAESAFETKQDLLTTKDNKQYPPTPRGGVCRAGRKTCLKENPDRLPGGAVCIQHHPGRPPSPGRGTKRQTSPCYQTPAD